MNRRYKNKNLPKLLKKTIIFIFLLPIVVMKKFHMQSFLTLEILYISAFLVCSTTSLRQYLSIFVYISICPQTSAGKTTLFYFLHMSNIHFFLKAVDIYQYILQNPQIMYKGNLLSLLHFAMLQTDTSDWCNVFSLNEEIIDKWKSLETPYDVIFQYICLSMNYIYLQTNINVSQRLL